MKALTGGLKIEDAIYLCNVSSAVAMKQPINFNLSVFAGHCMWQWCTKESAPTVWESGWRCLSLALCPGWDKLWPRRPKSLPNRCCLLWNVRICVWKWRALLDLPSTNLSPTHALLRLSSQRCTTMAFIAPSVMMTTTLRSSRRVTLSLPSRHLSFSDQNRSAPSEAVRHPVYSPHPRN